MYRCRPIPNTLHTYCITAAWRWPFGYLAFWHLFLCLLHFIHSLHQVVNPVIGLLQVILCILKLVVQLGDFFLCQSILVSKVIELEMITRGSSWSLLPKRIVYTTCISVSTTSCNCINSTWTVYLFFVWATSYRCTVFQMHCRYSLDVNVLIHRTCRQSTLRSEYPSKFQKWNFQQYSISPCINVLPIFRPYYNSTCIFTFPFPLSSSSQFSPLHWDHLNSRNGISNNVILPH